MSSMNSEVHIAIIGMSYRFSGGATNPEKLWKLLAEGRSGWSEIPSSRFNLDGVWHPFFEKLNNMNVRGGHFLDEDVGLFDAAFFGLSAETAASLDPQFRLQLESTYEALENAGIKLEDVAGSNTSVFGGTFFRDYHDGALRDPETLPRFLLVGVGSAMASNRVSHFYDLRGASMSLDTGCSTTLVALHQACQNLRAGESDMSIVGGANVILNPDNFIAMSSLRLISPSGKSYAFDDRASGYGRGEGSATVVLKRLDDALRDGDPIRAVIRGTGCNQDGRTDTITTPSQQAQEQLMRKVYETSGLDPKETTYFEAHGTGTPTGDPIECRAIATVFKSDKPKDQALRIGSIKTNVGHTETTSGLASIIKVALALEKGQIPPSINFQNPNPNIDLDGWNLKIPREVEAWPAFNGVQRASVNNFGYGGANAHVIMESYQSYLTSMRNSKATINGESIGVPKSIHLDTPRSLTNGHVNGSYINQFLTNTQPKDLNNGHADGFHTNGASTNGHDSYEAALGSRVFMLSAKDEQTAQRMATNLKEYLTKTEVIDETSFLDSLAYTLGQRRSIFNWIAAQLATSVSSLIEAIDSGKTMKPVRAKGQPRIGFVFTGQGAQWYAMGRELIPAYPIFRECLMEADGYLKEFGCSWSLMEEILKDAESSRVNEPVMSMPLCAAVQISLVRLLKSWGVVPSGITSHSSGEIAAAYAAGVLTLKDAMAIVFARGSLTGDASAVVANKVAGGMLAIGSSATEVTTKYLPHVSSGQVVVACLNSPSSITASGDVPGIEELEKMLKRDKVFARRLKVDAAYHSHHMVAIQDTYLSWLQKLLKADGKIEDGIIYASPTTGTRISSGKILSKPEHWVRSLVKPVEFVKAFTEMCLGGDFESSKAAEVDLVVEVGPHAALGGPIAEIVAQPEFNGVRIPYYTCLLRKVDAVQTMQALACSLIREGHPLNMDAINFPRGRGDALVLHDLPPYPWNHNTRHWAETRYNKSHRHRTEAPHDLLGSLAVGTNLLAPSWRLIIRPLDLPWVRDHVIQGTMLYPGGGFVCMAIEGACQAAAPKAGQRIVGVELRDIDIMAALVVPDTNEGIEVQLTLRQTSEKMLYTKDYKEFHIYSVTGENKWTEHCKGLIAVDLAAEDEEQTQSKSSAGRPTSFTPRKMSDYRKRLDSRDIYAAMHSVGIQHGPIFQNLKDIRARSKQSVSVVQVPDTAAGMPYAHQHAHVIHPVTLDTIFQSAYASLPGAGSKMSATLLPRSIRKLWVSYDMISSAGHRFRAHSDVNRASSQSFDTDITVTSDKDDSSEIVLAIDGFAFQSIGDALITVSEPWESEKFSKVEWAPDFTLSEPARLKEKLRTAAMGNEVGAIAALRRLCINYISKAMETLTLSEVEKMPPQFKQYCSWMSTQLELARSGKLGTDSSLWLNDAVAEALALSEKVKATGVAGELVAQVGRHLTAILKGTVDTLELAQEGTLLSQYYGEGLGWGQSNRQVCQLVKQFAHTNPRGKILEINAGTGGLTQHVLKILGASNSGIGPLASSYDFTDASSQLFEAAKENFAAWQDLINYKKFDVQNSPENQGFETTSYDMIIANQIFSDDDLASKNALANIRQLLKPGGKLILTEIVRDELDMQFIAGLLPGHGIQVHAAKPSISMRQWHQLLLEAELNVETDIFNSDNETEATLAVILAKAASKPPVFDFETVIVTGDLVPPVEWLSQITSSIASVTGKEPTIEPLASASGENKLVIFLPELGTPILKDPTEAQFDAVKALCTNSKGLLWLTRGGAVECENIDFSLCSGFLRCVRFEYHGKRLVSLDLDPTRDSWSSEYVTDITKVFAKAFDYSVDDAMQDFEFAARNGEILIPRYYKDAERNLGIFRDPSKASPVLEPFKRKGRPLQLVAETPGTLDSLAFTDNQLAFTELPSDYLEIEPRAFGVNHRDVMAALGQSQEDEPMGCECSGVVTGVGTDVAAQGFKVGDRVAALLNGNISNTVRTRWTGAVRIPSDMSFEAAAAIPVAYTTAYAAIIEAARLRKGDTILIRAATGAVGQAAIALAQHIGAKIFVTVGSEEKGKFVMKKYNIPASHIFSSRDASFVSDVLEMTHKKGVDVVMNTLSGSLMQESLHCTAPFGRFVNISKSAQEANHALNMSVFGRGFSFLSIDLAAMIEHKDEEVHRILAEAFGLLSEKAIASIDPVTIFPLSKLQEAFRLLEGGQNIGKVVLSVGADEIVPVLPLSPKAEFRANSSYLVIGGLGGIGQAVCHWMVDRGVKNLIIVSRSAGDKAQPMVQEMGKRGCKVKAIGCDISIESNLARALAECTKDMPPIRGVIQGAMVLQDSILEQMVLADYVKATRPKVQGTWNLHHLLSAIDLDFFIILSSFAAVIGFASQCNYSAGGTYEDAIARYRSLRGLPCVSIDIGVVLNVGVVAEHDTIEERLRKSGHTLLTEDDVMKAVESAIADPPPCAQMMIGLNPGPGPHWEYSGMARDLRFAPLKYEQKSGSSMGKAGGNDLGSVIAGAESFSEAVDAVVQALSEKLKEIFMISEIVPTDSLADHGVDSLVAVELRNMLALKAGAAVSIFDIMSSSSIIDLATTVTSKSSFISPALIPQ